MRALCLAALVACGSPQPRPASPAPVDCSTSTETGELRGTVLDAKQRPLQTSVMVASACHRGPARFALTDEHGVFDAPELPAGTYDISIAGAESGKTWRVRVNGGPVTLLNIAIGK